MTANGFDEIMADATPAVREAAEATRALIRAVYPAVVEVPWPRQRVIGCGVGSKKMSEHFCYIAVHGDHVNLGFNHGSELPDPERLLGGPGKHMRHTRITSLADLENSALRAILVAATTHRMPNRAGMRMVTAQGP